MKTIPIRAIPTALKEPNIMGSFSIRAVETLLSGNDMVQERHRHDFFWLLVLEKGAGTHEIDFTHYDLTDHSVFLLRPGQVHQLHLQAGSTGYLMQFKTDFLYSHNSAAQNHLTKLIQFPFYQFEATGFRKIATLLEEALDEYITKAKGYPEILKAKLSILLIELLRQRQEKAMPTVPGTPYAQEKLEHFLELVEAHSMLHRQVSHYTDLLHLSSYQLSTITKTLLNKTPSEIITDYLVLEAKRQLLATSNQVSQIAYNLGFDDASYFIRFFRKHAGFSPETFRQNSR